MRFAQAPPSLLSLLVVALSSTATAGPYPKDEIHDIGFSFLMDRACIAYCGSDNQYCCEPGTACYTVGTVAGCSTAAPQQTLASTPRICTIQGQTSCGIYCCASDQICGGPDTCIPRPDSSYIPIPTGNPAPTYSAPYSTPYSAPYRPTSTGVVTVTSAGSVTRTAAFLAPATASGSIFPTALPASGGGLSPGAIAGIVIGVIAGILLLILLCFCCIVKAGFDGLLAIFGLGKRKRSSTERIETVEHYSRHGSGAGSRRDSHGNWYGGKPSRVDSSRKKKSSGFGGLGALGAGLTGLALVLGLKRKHDKEKPARSDVSSSYYTDSFTGTSESSASSDRRTRDSRRPR